MEKALLISILVASVIIPLRASRIQDRTKAIRKMDRQLFVFSVVYVLGLVVLYPLLKAK